MFLDGSAPSADLLMEPGEERVLEVILARARMTTVNFSEVAARSVLNGATETQSRALKARLPVTLSLLDDEAAIQAGLMVAVTRPAELSLGVLTADRAWLSIADAVGVPVELIR